jgi:hypothetical protein
MMLQVRHNRWHTHARYSSEVFTALGSPRLLPIDDTLTCKEMHGFLWAWANGALASPTDPEMEVYPYHVSGTFDPHDQDRPTYLVCLTDASNVRRHGSYWDVKLPFRTLPHTDATFGDLVRTHRGKLGLMICFPDAVEVGNLVPTGALLPPLALPPVPPSETIVVQTDSTEVLRAWLDASAEVCLGSRQRLDATRRVLQIECDGAIAQAQEWFERSVEDLKTELGNREATAVAARDDALMSSESFTEMQKMECSLLTVRQRINKAEKLGRFLVAAPLERPDEHLCPITRELLRDPVIISCGDTFERWAIAKWFEDNDTCPACRAHSGKTLMPNKIIKKLVNDWDE